MKYTFTLLLVFSALLSPVFSQNLAKKSIWVAPFQTDYDTIAKLKLAEIRGQVIIFLLKNGSISVVERDANSVVERERNLQKSEAFIDGKYVEQGKAVGADYILQSTLQKSDGQLVMKIMDVATGEALASETSNIGANLKWGENNLATSPSWRKIRNATNSLLNKFLAKDKVSVVRILEEKGDEAKLILVAGGTAKGLKEKSKLDIFLVSVEMVDEEKLERFDLIGEGKVDEVENANFSKVKIKDGEKEVKKAILEGKKLYCRLQID